MLLIRYNVENVSFKLPVHKHLLYGIQYNKFYIELQII